LAVGGFSRFIHGAGVLARVEHAPSFVRYGFGLLQAGGSAGLGEAASGAILHGDVQLQHVAQSTLDMGTAAGVGGSHQLLQARRRVEAIAREWRNSPDTIRGAHPLSEILRDTRLSGAERTQLLETAAGQLSTRPELRERMLREIAADNNLDNMVRRRAEQLL